MKLEHAGRNGGGRNGGRAGRRVLFSLFLFDFFLVPDLGYLRYGLLRRGKTYKALGNIADEPFSREMRLQAIKTSLFLEKYGPRQGDQAISREIRLSNPKYSRKTWVF